MPGYVQNKFGVPPDNVIHEIPNATQLAIEGGIAIFKRQQGVDTIVLAAIKLTDDITVSVGEHPLPSAP